MDFVGEPEYPRRNSETQTMNGTDTPWLFASFARGLRRCIVPLLSGAERGAEYTVRLYFADFDNKQAGKRVFDIKLQGQLVLEDFDIAREAGGSFKAIIRQFRGIAVSRDLEIELVAQDKKLSSKNGVPVLCGVEVVRERKTAEVATTAHSRQ
jgi:hypothetical protein